MRGKRIKDKLRAGRPVFTTGLKFHAPRLVEMLARSGADQIFLDAEHGPITEAECEEMVRAADLYDVPVAIRVPTNEPHVILRYLDIGTSAIMAPHVTTRADAARAVAAVKYPPEGTRSFAPAGAPSCSADPPEYVRRSNEETVVYASSRMWPAWTRSTPSVRCRASTAWRSGPTTSRPRWGTRASRGARTSRRWWNGCSRLAVGAACPSDGAPGPGRPPAPDRARLSADHGGDARVGDPGDARCRRRAVAAAAGLGRRAAGALRPQASPRFRRIRGSGSWCRGRTRGRSPSRRPRCSRAASTRTSSGIAEGRPRPCTRSRRSGAARTPCRASAASPRATASRSPRRTSSARSRACGSRR